MLSTGGGAGLECRMVLSVPIITPSPLSEPCANTAHLPLQDLLARVHLKLGDMQKFNGKFGDAMEDYDACLSLRRSFLPPHDRAIGDVHYSLAQATEYAAADAECPEADAEALRARSLHHYGACRAVFQTMVDALKAKAVVAPVAEDRSATLPGKGKGKASASPVASAAELLGAKTSPTCVGRTTQMTVAEIEALGLGEDDTAELKVTWPSFSLLVVLAKAPARPHHNPPPDRTWWTSWTS